MTRLPVLAVSTFVAGLAVIAAAPSSFAASPAASPAAGRAVFVQTNDLAQNSIVAFTRGRGGVERDVPLDPLASQDSLTYDPAHRLLFAVNAGSNTVTSFVVHGARLTRVQTVPSGGVFPVSLAAGHNRLYVLNAGRSGNVTGYRISPSGRLAGLPHASRDLRLGNDPVPEFITAPADIAQTPDGDELVVSTKANNTLDVFPIGRGGALSAPVRNAAAADVPFALSFDTAGRLVVANAGTSSVSTYAVRKDGTLDTITPAVEDGQDALC